MGGPKERVLRSQAWEPITAKGSHKTNKWTKKNPHKHNGRKTKIYPYILDQRRDAINDSQIPLFLSHQKICSILSASIDKKVQGQYWRRVGWAALLPCLLLFGYVDLAWAEWAIWEVKNNSYIWINIRKCLSNLNYMLSKFYIIVSAPYMSYQP